MNENILEITRILEITPEQLLHDTTKKDDKIKDENDNETISK